LEQIRYGVFQARRAGLGANDVWNTLSYERFREGLLERRGRKLAGKATGTKATGTKKPRPEPVSARAPRAKATAGRPKAAVRSRPDAAAKPQRPRGR